MDAGLDSIAGEADFHTRADVEAAGATFADEPVVVDGNLVTSRGWPDLPYFMPAFLSVVAAATKP